MGRYRTDIREIEQLAAEERQRLRPVTETYVFRVNDYYLSLIDWDDPDDPIRRIVIPSEVELAEYGSLDPSDEESNYVAPGCQHKYGPTALLLVSKVCGAYCRFCFRKRLFREDVEEHHVSMDVEPGLRYIAAHPEITNVLLTGGDPLMLSPRRLDQILTRLRAIPHVKVIRIGTKIPAFEPMRVTDNPELLEVLRRHSRADARIHFSLHFNHPREMTEEALRCIIALQEVGVTLVNQTPLLRRVNDDPAVLAELLERLTWWGIAPYYIFQNRPVAGNADFVVPLREGYRIVEQAKARVSGYAKRVRYVMSHATGKIEILAVEGERIYLKYHQARNPEDYGRFLVCRLTDDAAWFDDLQPVA
ncbi:L-lysine 2,3-aminomutase [Thermaerobacter marianensis DSM 12885]|uniref:L-lysine 2,3-aminomutase n=1 Tax=Thermaerobacter marianensis (strain ATCC 700841 / DSM 12885 / JCM 10246 / 7p75a) TaxID=644966 RepID=E6SGJ5_THEM7|nr:KamA family radical SAM protein [Thermaerobacter marianensis]ADU50541.1 L-lysine 2,3-aminomutase [Thermaerobacter marianensis DSM 12885]